ncbi:MAG: hypothetical protein PHD51_03315 [Patescibacteria group bacterium]|nr:hypothetical protein [Patescibacteria group bacterium]MDD5490992.1 hypothetical protein [Patescibacteria group bacterium]
MDWNRTKKLTVRWSILSAAFFALFWGIWYFIAGEVPELTQISLGEGTVYQLPFPISRWWDILSALIFTNTIIFVIKKDPSILVDGLLISLFLGLFFGLIFGLILGLAISLICSIIIILFIGLYNLFWLFNNIK